jgi:hypothetical protein
MRVASRKRSSSRPKARRQGLSGNPQRRAEQLQVRQDRQVAPDRSAFRELAYHLAGGASAAPWWGESHQRILDRARTLTWPSRLVDLETHACQIVGDEFYDRLNSRVTGLHPVQWLRALAEETGAALRAELAEGAGDWKALWALLCGLALTAPRTPVGALTEADLRARAEFPDIKDPYETALAEAEEVAKLLADRGLAPVIGSPTEGCQPAGEPMVARDAYGSRFLLVAPFTYEGDAPDHWYSWDIDSCWITAVVGAGVFDSAEDALREWRDAVGPATSGAALSPCAAEMTARLLASCLKTGVLGNMLQGGEPQELIREYYRLRRRARDLTGSTDVGTASSPFDADHERAAFVDWYAKRHGDVPEAVTAAVDTILDEWGPGVGPDERSFYACSPHRIEMAAHLMRQSHFADYANPALLLLPEWTQWCVERSGLDGDILAARSLDAARSAASSLLDEEDDEPVDSSDEAPFRRKE